MRLLKYVVVAAVSLTAVLFLYNLLQHSSYISAVARFASYGFFDKPDVLFRLFALLTFCLARIVVVSFSTGPSRSLIYSGIVRFS